ncbi:unnamed protein product [Adineta steineri]|uniref:Uncharacterized protein n=1 Tax=Adineta steineri TaxID=433720 RepID=A0A813MR24_9BILA|nr:unnamed protein product [Adineta steineri]CAF0841603.1 unnamed protein product [Adineta steineri]CAF0911088.1 unnamed protein product [Adineta steineri]
MNTTEPIGCNGLPYQNINHTKLYYEVTSYSQIELSSCDNGKIDFQTFWFVIDDLCKYNRTSDIYFATIYPNKTSYCPETKSLKPPSNSPDLKIILPIVLTLAFAVVIITIGFFYYRRRLRNKKSGIYKQTRHS